MDPMSLGPYSTIIKFLERYKEGIDIELLARRLKRDESEIKEYLLRLQEEGVINLQDNKVWLQKPTS